MSETTPNVPRQLRARLPPHRPAPRAEEGPRGVLGRPHDRRRGRGRPPPTCARRTRTRLAELGLATDVPAIPSAFSFYDHVLDATAVVGAVPARFADVVGADGALDLAGYSTVARGRGDDLPLEMTKWFDTNYHYLVPEIGPETDVPLRERPPGAGVHGGPRGRRPHASGHRRPGHVPRPGQGHRGRAGGLRARSTASRTCCPSTPSCSRTSPPRVPPGSSSRSPRWSPTRSPSRPSSCSPP